MRVGWSPGCKEYNKMKWKGKLTLVTVGLGLLCPLSAQAAVTEQSSSAKATATVEVDPGELTLAQAPSFAFESAQIGQNQTLKVNPTTAEAAGTTVAKQLEIHNFVGSGDPWTLSVKLGDFKGKSGHTLTGAVLKLPKLTFKDKATSTLTATEASVDVPAGTDSTLLLSAAKDYGMGSITGSLTGATLTLPQTNQLYSDEYSAELDYTLTANPVAN